MALPKDIEPAAASLVALCRSALNPGAERHSLSAEELAAAHELARFNGVEGLAWFGAEGSPELSDGLASEWCAEADAVLWRTAMFDAEREAVTAGLESLGMSWMPLKGILTQGYYPRPEMRSMCDNDILYGWVDEQPGGGYANRGRDADKRERLMREGTEAVVAMMEGLGYSVRSVGTGNEDTFSKPPVFNFELHRMLVSVAVPQHASFANPWERAVRTGELSFGMTKEDEYLYTLAHANKHYEGSGCGIRCAVDQFVFLRRFAGALDWGYVERGLEALGLARFESELRSLGEACLSDEPRPLSEGQRHMLLRLVTSGTYGTHAQRVRGRVERLREEGAEGRAGLALAYLKDICVPSEGVLQLYHPTLYKYPVLRPAYPLIKLAKTLRSDPGRLARELRLFREAKRG